MISGKIIQYIENHQVWNILNISELNKSHILKLIISKFDNDKFDTFVNNFNGILSQNNYIESLIFDSISREPNYDNFNFNDIVDLKSIIATSNSLIQRPDIVKPDEIIEGFGEPDLENGFIRMARFEKQLIQDNYRRYSKAILLFEGLLPLKIETNPLINQLSSQYIWKDKFYRGESIIQGVVLSI